MTRRHLPPPIFAASLIACAVLSGACDHDTQTNPTPAVAAGGINRSPEWVGLAGATSYTFTASGFSASDGGPLTYAWDFGDRTQGAIGATVTHTYMIDWYRFTVTVTATSAGGATSQASLAALEVKAVTGRWGIRDALGGLVFGSTHLTQDSTRIWGDDTRLDCRYDVTGAVSAPRSISLTYTRPPGDCQAWNQPVSITFTGQADDGVNRFTGTLAPGGPATLVKCPEPFGCQ